MMVSTYFFVIYKDNGKVVGGGLKASGLTLEGSIRVRIEATTGRARLRE